MPVSEGFYEIWLGAPEIHARDPVSGFEVITLSVGPKDKEVAKRWRGNLFMKGAGSREKPLQGPAADHSPHFRVFEMWFILRSRTTEENPLFIEVNDMVFSVVPEGVVAEDGQPTQLLS